MKKVIIILALVLGVQFAEASPLKDPKKELTEAQKTRLAEMETRLIEIKSMDFKSMSKVEIAAIKSEMKDMKAEARVTGNGVYFSVGAIIIIILLLILLL
jgi:hypothetical protein